MYLPLPFERIDQICVEDEESTTTLLSSWRANHAESKVIRYFSDPESSSRIHYRVVKQRQSSQSSHTSASKAGKEARGGNKTVSDVPRCHYLQRRQVLWRSRRRCLHRLGGHPPGQTRYEISRFLALFCCCDAWLFRRL